MEFNSFQVGDRVQLSEDGFHRIDPNNSLFPGLTGTIAAIYPNGDMGVEWDFDEPKRECHTLDGACEDGYGWWVPPEALIPEEAAAVPVDQAALFAVLFEGG